jgi:hypothetical protein
VTRRDKKTKSKGEIISFLRHPHRGKKPPPPSPSPPPLPPSLRGSDGSDGSDGAMERWSDGSDGAMERWSDGSYGAMELWSYGAMELWSYGVAINGAIEASPRLSSRSSFIQVRAGRVSVGRSEVFAERGVRGGWCSRTVATSQAPEDRARTKR